ncbi:long-chain fatty acid--CoA ligase [Shewanella avicenniae]|uniref:Long-chain-fatty-acid--CoA ligase n=1 Tax=Shewanella avicenniae TaxID=2814294 RepID=A0ABX7QTY4_9GAMM|nr:long-chain fatty acid--CoA ligase [Shewanella avicenniae]QSX34391.1 long-chain fatty acid--CoA ligase [Shewanella avicenniae]
MTTPPLQQSATPKSPATSLAQLIELVCFRFADNTAFSCRGVKLSFNQLEQDSRAFAAWLQHNSPLKPGDRIALQLPNCLQYIICGFGALRAGLVLVNTNPQYTESELVAQFNDAEVQALVVISDLLPTLAKVSKSTPLTTIISTHLNDLLKPVPQPRTALKNVEFNQVIAAGRALTFTAPVIESDALALLQYTGGTTGVNKGAMLSHRNLLANMTQCYERLQRYIQDGEEQLLSPLPIYHVYSFMVHLLYFAHGASATLLPIARSLDEMIEAWTQRPATTFAGISGLFSLLCHHPKFQELDFSRLKLTIAGATSLTEVAAKQWYKCTGCAISQGYGLTETSPVVSINLYGEQLPLSVGTPLAETEIRIVDDNDQPVANGAAGELLVKGPQLMQGYWRQAEENEAAFTEDGYFRTGDIVRADDAGNLVIVDRKKEIIIVSGVNVYPTEVEAVLNSHPEVVQAAVFGVPHERTGEQVQARIVLAPQTRNIHEIEAALQQLCEEQLAPYKIPKVLQFDTELPLNNVGKIMRRQLSGN